MKHLILYLSRGGDIGGSQKQILNLIKKLDFNQYEPVVICSQQGEFTEQLARLNVEYQIFSFPPWRKLNSLLKRLKALRLLQKFCQLRQFSLIHCSCLWANGYSLALAKALCIPSVLHVRTPLSIRDVRKHCCQRATKIVAISKRIHTDLIRAGIQEDKITVIQDSINTAAFCPEARQRILEKRFATGNLFKIGLVGRIQPSKRQLDFLKAVLKLNGSKKNLMFFFIGPFKDLNYLSQIKQFILKTNPEFKIYFTGQCDNMPAILSELDILVTLTGGSVMYEALACETPVISAFFTSPKDSVIVRHGENSLLVYDESLEKLAGAINQLTENPRQCEIFGKRGREIVLEQLSPAIMAEKIQSIYAGLFANGKTVNKERVLVADSRN